MRYRKPNQRVPIPRGVVSGDLFTAIVDGKECWVKCPPNKAAGDLVDVRHTVVIVKPTKPERKVTRRCFPLPSKEIVSIWLIAEIVFMACISLAVSVEVWSSIDFSVGCSAMANCTLRSLELNVYAGLGSEDSCFRSEQLSGEFCFRFTDHKTWSALDSLLHSSTLSDAITIIPTAQVLFPVSACFAFFGAVCFGLFLYSQFVSKYLAFRLYFGGLLMNIIASALAGAALFLVSYSNIASPLLWEQFVKKGNCFDRLTNSIQQDNPLMGAGNSGNCLVVNSFGPGETLALACFSWSAWWTVSMVANGCCGLSVCSWCTREEEQEPDILEALREKRIDYEDPETRRLLPEVFHVTDRAVTADFDWRKALKRLESARENEKTYFNPALSRHRREQQMELRREDQYLLSKNELPSGQLRAELRRRELEEEIDEVLAQELQKELELPEEEGNDLLRMHPHSFDDMSEYDDEAEIVELRADKR